MSTNNKRSEEIKDDALIATLKGHTDFVRGVAITPDGRLIVSGSWDRTIKVWNVLTNQLLATLEGHTGSVWCVAITPDGKRIVSGSSDKKIKIWDGDNYQLLATLEGHLNEVMGVAITSDGNRVVSCSCDKTVKIWDSQNYKLLATLEGHTNHVLRVAISFDGNCVVSGSRDNTIRVWNGQSHQLLAKLEGHLGCVYGIAVSSDGKRIVTSGEDKTIKVWDGNSLKLIATLEGHTDAVRVVAISPEGKRIISGSWSKTVMVWDGKSFKALATLIGHTGAIYGASVTDEGKIIVSGSDDSTVKVWDGSEFNNIHDENSGVYTAAKVVLVGETSVGKSGLMIRLTEDVWRETGSTHGMNVKKIPLLTENNDPFDKEIWLWDFAGQPDYKLIHQLFLSNTSLGLLIYNPQDPKTLDTLAEWDALLSRAIKPRPPLLLVAGRCDVGSSRESDETMQQFMAQHNSIGHHKTSAKIGVGCRELKQDIIDKIPWDQLPVTSSPKRFKALKENIYNLSNTESLSPLIPDKLLIEKLRMMSRDDPFEMAELKTVRELLAAQGLLFKLPYGDLWLLKPDLLNAYASSILLTARRKSEVGCVDKAKIVNAELEFEQLGESRLPESDEKLLLPAILQLMGERQISLEEETNDGDKIIFPAVFRIARPTKPEIPSLAAIYQFEGLVDDIYASLVVRLYYSKRFVKQAIWKDAADFVTAESGHPAGIALERKGDAKAEIQVYFEGDTPEAEKNVFRRFIFEHLTNKSSDSPASIPLYFCPYCNWQIPYDVANKRLKAGKTEFICSDCGESFAIALALESQPITKHESDALGAMDRAIHIALDNRSKALLQTGEVMVQVAITNQIFRLVTMEDVGIDAEIELLDDASLPTSKRIYLQLKSGDSFLRKRVNDNRYTFRLKNERLLKYYQNSDSDVLLVIRPSTGNMLFINATKYLQKRLREDPDHANDLTIVFDGKPFTADEILTLRKEVLAKF